MHNNCILKEKYRKETLYVQVYTKQQQQQPFFNFEKKIKTFFKKF